MKRFQINCDLGEGSGHDHDLMPWLDRCSIACGGHVGDAESMRKTVALALKCGVKPGAHPSYPDRKHFGRKSMKMDLQQLEDSLIRQVAGLKRVCEEQGVNLDHLKAHGALYNDAARDEQLAEAVVKVAHAFGLKVLAPWQSAMEKVAKKYFVGIIAEAFADRMYGEDRQLVPRTDPKAMVTDVRSACKQVISIAQKGQVLTAEGKSLPMKAETFCVHGDSRFAVEIVRALHTIQYEK